MQNQNLVLNNQQGLICHCSRKNFVFLFGALINLTVRIDAYFHPIRMTYPIQPGPYFQAALNWGKPPNTFCSSELLRSGQT